MSCSLASEDSLDLIKQESQNSKLDPWVTSPPALHKMVSNIPGLFRFQSTNESPLYKLKDSKGQVFELPRGGCVVISTIGPIQFGIPPETVKDSLNLGFEIPQYYVIPSSRWDKMFHMSVAEFEFPAYFNFFVKKKKITLICTKEAKKAIRVIFRETLLGPKKFEGFDEEFFNGYKGKPDIVKELAHFSKNPFNHNLPLTVSSLLDFIIFDENGLAYLQNEVTIRKEQKQFTVLEKDAEIAIVRDRIRIRVDENLEDYKDQLRYGLFMNPSIEMDEKKLEVYKEKYKPIQFDPPTFGVTILGSGHGFDPKGNTSGYILWINGRGVMVDPPPFSTHLLKKMGVPSIMIEWIIITHCHADHDAGTFQKILESTKVEIITTKTIMGSFIRKYSAVVDINEKDLSQLFKFRPVVIGTPLKFNGASFNFFYSLHAIPCIGFSVTYKTKSMYFSGDTYYDPTGMLKMVENGVLSAERYDSLCNEDKWKHDLIFHEAGVPPIHTPMKVLANLPSHVKERLFLVHTSAKDIPADSGLKMAKPGIEATLKLDVPEDQNSYLLKTLDIISSIEMFEKSNIKNVRDLMDSSTELKMKAGEIICKDGEPANDFYIILRGIVKIWSTKKERAFERYCHQGDYFGESALKEAKNAKRMADVQAVTDVTLLSIKTHDFWFIFGDNDEVIGRMFNLMQATRSKALNIMMKNSFLAIFSSSQKIQMEMMMRERNYKKGDVICVKGAQPEYGYMVANGFLEIFDCPEAALGDHLGIGSFVCEFDAFLNNKNLTMNVRVSEDAEVFVVSKKEINQFMRNNPGLMLLVNKTKYIL